MELRFRTAHDSTTPRRFNHIPVYHQMAARNKERNAFRSYGELGVRVPFSRKALWYI